MEKDFGAEGPHVVQARTFEPEVWFAVKGYDEEKRKHILADPEEKLTIVEALARYKELNPTGQSALYRLYRWHPPGQTV